MLGDIDLHLFGEGRHEEIYKKLGAHVAKVGRTKGVAFAVWAPHARGVSVVGDFNGWNGKDHRMQRLGNSGVWEIFIPKLTPAVSTNLKSSRQTVHGYSKPIPTRNTQKSRLILHRSSTTRSTSFANKVDQKPH